MYWNSEFLEKTQKMRRKKMRYDYAKVNSDYFDTCWLCSTTEQNNFCRSYNTATPSDLWSSIQTTLDTFGYLGVLPSEESVESVMETWNSQSGYPVVYVERNYNTGSVTFSQSRFLIDHATHNYSETYSVPINYATSDYANFEDTKPEIWLTNASLYHEASLNNSSWIIVNKQQTGTHDWNNS